MLAYTFIISCLLSLVACFSDNKHAVTKYEVRCGDSVTVKLQDSFTVKMQVPVASGFRWVYSDSIDLARLTVPNPPPSIPNDSTMDGGYGYQLFKYVAVKKGSGFVHFKFLRAFGGATKFDDSCRVYLAVE